MKLESLLIVIIGLFGCNAIHDKFITVDSYAGYKVFRVIPENRGQLEALYSLTDHPHLDFWTEIGLNRPVDIMATPYMRSEISGKLAEIGLNAETLINDVQATIDHVENMRPTRNGMGKLTWDDYYHFEDIEAFLTEISNSNDDAEVEVIGKSTEGRNLTVIKFCRGGCGNKTAVWTDGGIHAREWISPATVTYAINELHTDPDKYSDLLDNLDWYFLPVHNPDGYEYTFKTTHRLWRKTRSRQGLCYGVDANRNYGFHWGETGASDFACTDTYHGPSAFSEPETAAASKYVASLPNIKYFQSVHSYSQLILFPWGYTRDNAATFDDLTKVGRDANAALYATHNTEYEVGSISHVLYLASGSSVDWAYDLGIPYTYTIECRDTGRHGFLLPPDQIIPTAEEVWAFHQSVANVLINKIP